MREAGLLGVTNMWGGATADDTDPPLVRFSATTTDASYILPSFYEQWAISPAGSPRAAFWRGAASVGRAFFHNVTHPVTGLNPDQATFTGAAARGSTFAYDAWRTARNIAVDLAWYAADYDWQVGFCNRLLGFFRGLSTWPSYGSTFQLDGTVVGRGHATGLVSMNAVRTPSAAHTHSALLALCH